MPSHKLSALSPHIAAIVGPFRFGCGGEPTTPMALRARLLPSRKGREEVSVGSAVSIRRHGSLTVRIEPDERSLAVRAAGELDLASASGLEDTLLHALESGASSIVLDLTGVTFIDPAGLRVVMWASERSRVEGNRLRIDCGSIAVHRLIEVTGMERPLPATT